MNTNNVFMLTRATHSNGQRVDMTPTVEFYDKVASLNEKFCLKFKPKDFEALVVQMYNRRINGNIRGHQKAFSERVIEYNYKKGRLEFLKAGATADGIELTVDVTDQLCKIVRETNPKSYELWGNELFKLRWGHVA